MNDSRGVFRHADLRRLIDPASIAVVGASPTPNSFGARTCANLADFDGRLMLVNARHEAIGERPCFASVSALPEVPDCVVIMVPRDLVEGVVIECAERGVGGLIIFSSGYSETGKPELVALQERLAAIAREARLRIMGPNCVGMVNFMRKAVATFTPGIPRIAPRGPAIGLVSQSGALGLGLSQAVQTGMSVSHMLTTGNSCDTDIADYISYLADDPGCRAIACLFEGMASPQRLLEAAGVANAAGKPLVVYKIATTAQGATASMSHTGSLSGSAAAWRATFDRAGMVVVDSFEALMETAAFFAKAPAPLAEGVAVISSSGGAGIIASDKADLHGISLPQPGPAAQNVLEANIPDFGSARNPCDVTAQVATNPQSMVACTDALLSDPAYGTLVAVFGSAQAGDARVKTYSDLARKNGKIVAAAWLTTWNDGPGSEVIEADPHLALFRSMDRCMSALAAWHKRHRRLQSGERKLSRCSPPSAKQAGAQLISEAGAAVLTERESKAVIALYGVPVTKETLARDAAGACAAAADLGYPVALKVESPDIAHKTEADVIRLGLKNESEVRSAYETVLANASSAVPAARIQGVLVQSMAAKGVEVMVGARIDPLAGPLIVVGLGGTMVELMNDTALALAPVDHGEALAMLQSLKGYKALTGFRGTAPVDLERLADIVQRLSELAADQQGHIVEFDVNPLICASTQIVAVDALIIRSGAARSDPSLAFA